METDQEWLQIDTIADFFRDKTQATEVSVTAIKKLTGGAIQQNFAVQVAIKGGDWAGEHNWVLRCDSESEIGESMTREQEYALLVHAYDNGVRVPKPLWLGDSSLIGRPFFVMEQVYGITQGSLAVNAQKYTCDRDTLVRELGDQLARIHAMNDAPQLNFLPTADTTSGIAQLKHYQAYLASLEENYPIIELAIRQLLINAPDISAPVISHRDYRTGNFMLNEQGLVAVLDWEFSGWSNRHEDIGWFCAPCWRFSRRDLEAGGLGERELFYEAYESRSGVTIDPKQASYFELFATVRWAIIAIEQSYRHLSGAQSSLELALTGHIVPVLEKDLLLMLEHGYV